MSVTGGHAARFLAIGLALVTLLAAQASAVAQPNQRGRGEARAEQIEEGGQVESTVQVRHAEQPGQRGDGDSAGRVTSTTNPVVYYWRPVDQPVGSLRCPAGYQWQEQVRYDRVTDTEDIVGPGECINTLTPRFAAAPEPPPPAPTLEEIGDLADDNIAPPPITANPDWGSVTGLETWLWYEGQNVIEVTANIRGYTTTATMRPTTYIWDMGDGQMRRSTIPGSEERPAANHVYSTKDHYTLTLTVVWNGTWEFVGNGAAADGDLTTIQVTSSRPYQVNEIRSELIDTG